MSLLRTGLLVGLLGCLAPPVQAEPLELIIDADYSISYEGARAIELGVRTALRASGDRLGGLAVSVSPRDHHANSKRSLRTMRDYLASERAIAVIGGVHSPPYLTYKDFINDNGVLLMLPWSAAGPITRASVGDENWIFRLSVDDSKAGRFLIDQASADGCAATALLLVDTGWGRANQAAMTAAFRDQGRSPAAVVMFNTGIGHGRARAIAQQIADARADCVIMLADATEASHLVMSLHSQAPNVKIFSHWAILGRNFPQIVSHKVRDAMSLRVLQTCGLRVEREGGETLAAALALARRGGDAPETLSDIPAPAGFVHGHDLTLLLIAAADQARDSAAWAGGIADKRRALRTALQDLQAPVHGVLRTYDRAFRPYAADDPDAHEALGARDLCMARFAADGRLQDASSDSGS